jgi:hypothetical protein
MQENRQQQSTIAIIPPMNDSRGWPYGIRRIPRPMRRLMAACQLHAR